MKQFVVAALLLFSVLSTLPLAAQDVGSGGIGGRPAFPREDNPRSQSIFIHTIDAGESVEDGIRVINNAPETKTIAVYATDSQVSSGGAFACEQAVDTADDVGTWISLSKNQITLDSAGSEVIPFTIDVPETADVGEHDGCIVVQEIKEDADVEQGIGLSFRTAIRVAILVPGEVSKQLELTSLSVDSVHDGVVLTPVITNMSNVSIDTDMQSFIRTLWGGTTSQVGGQFPVLREQQAELNFKHDKPFWGGWYGTAVEATYDASTDSFLGDDVIDQQTLSLSGPVIFVIPQPGAMALYLLVIAGLGYVLWIRRQQKRMVSSWKSHKVRNGEDLKYYEKETGVSWRKIARANNIKAPYTLETGQSLKLPPKQNKKKS